MEVTLYNCKGGKKIHVESGRIVEGEGGEYFDCKGLPVKTLRCTIALRGLELPSPEFVDSLLLGGVGAVIAPKGTKSALVDVFERPFVLDPMAPPEEVPEEGAVVLRALSPESSFGYKEKYGEWPIRHLGDKVNKNIILNPFWVTTWEAKMIKFPAFSPTFGAEEGISSPIPPELLEAIYVPYEPATGPDYEAKVAELITKSHYWNKGLRARHADEACWTFLGMKPPSLNEGEAMLWVGLERAEIVIKGKDIFMDEDLWELTTLL